MGDIVTISVNGTTARIESPLPNEVIQSIYKMCSFYIQGSEHSALYRMGRWDGHKHLFKMRYNSFPAGLLHLISNMLSTIGYKPEIHYKIPNMNILTPPITIQDIVENRWYQYAAAEAAILARRSVVRVATGGGKTVIAALIAARLNTNTLFLVHTKDLLRQAKDALNEFLGIECGQIGDGIIDIKPVTIGTIQTISRVLGKHYKKDSYSEENEEDNTDIAGREEALRKFVKTVGLLMQDEVHRVASDSAFEVANLIKNTAYRVGFSASPWRDDGADLMIEAAFGHQAFTMTASELIRMGYLMKPNIILRHIHEQIQPNGTYDQIYKDWVVENTMHNSMIIDDAESMLNNGRMVMILVKQIKHGEILKRMLRERSIECEFLSGSDNSTVRYDTINDLRNRRLHCLVATTIADEGLDIKPLDGLILAGRGKSSVRALQRVGRTLRPYGKLDPLIIDYYDHIKFLNAHTMRRIEIYKTEPEFNIT